MGFVIHWNESAVDLHVFPIPIPSHSYLGSTALETAPFHSNGLHSLRSFWASTTQQSLCKALKTQKYAQSLTSTNFPPSSTLTSLSLHYLCNNNSHNSIRGCMDYIRWWWRKSILYKLNCIACWLVHSLIWPEKRLIRADYNIDRVSLGKWCVTMVRGRHHKIKDESRRKIIGKGTPGAQEDRKQN